MALSASQVDKLGARLKAGPVTPDDLRLLDEYRRSFSALNAEVTQSLRETYLVEPTARPAKSTQTILDKLRRESTRLSSMQDVAGCRVIVPRLEEQRQLVARLSNGLTPWRIDDRLTSPSHGYRAMHLILRIGVQRYEIQIRTELQHLWAAVVEKLADRVGHALKYGGGPNDLRQELFALSENVAFAELVEDMLQMLSIRAEHSEQEQLRQRSRETRLLNLTHRQALREKLLRLPTEQPANQDET